MDRHFTLVEERPHNHSKSLSTTFADLGASPGHYPRLRSTTQLHLWQLSDVVTSGLPTTSGPVPTPGHPFGSGLPPEQTGPVHRGLCFR